MKRIFICAERFFPRGDAGANRVLYIAKALKVAGWNPIVISIGKSDEKYFDSRTNKFVFEGVEFKNITFSTSGTAQRIERLFLNGKKTISLLREYCLSDQDKVLVYSSTAPYTQAVLSYSSKVGAAVAIDIVEWHQPFQFQFGRLDIRYMSFMKCFNFLTGKAGNVVAISNYLANHFKTKGCNVIVLPIFVEPNENFEYSSETNKLNLIYPGNPYRKDSLENMLKGLSMLSVDEQNRICLHLTGVRRDMLEKSVPGNKALLDLPCINIHGFMEYDALMELYTKIDFAFIARPDNVVTRANFPSKVPELMNRGIPVIINDIGDIAGYLHNKKDCVLIKDTTSEAVCDAVRYCLKLRTSQIYEMHEDAFKSVHDEFNYMEYVETVNDYFQALK